MGLAVVQTRASIGLEAPLVTVETHISNGLPSLSIVGLPETAVKESRDRVRSALLNTHLEFPTRRITISLAPADLPKEGSRFDLPIALSILVASGQLPQDALSVYEFIGELGLSGGLRPVRGILASLLAAHKSEHLLILPQQNAEEAALTGMPILAATSILEVCAHLKKETLIAPFFSSIAHPSEDSCQDLSEVQGQAHAKRALEIAAAGRHSILLIGPPGTGKTMLANRLESLLPDLTLNEALEVAKINSLTHAQFDVFKWKKRPFRSPHHSASSTALVGGGNPPKPGEISLAHLGILFLDEFPEFHRSVLEALREPLESGYINISRAACHARFPANVQLVAAMNPCPCGYSGDESARCQCSPEKIQRYRHKLSGPLLDRIDMQIEVGRVTQSIVFNIQPSEGSPIIKQRVVNAWERQYKRQKKLNVFLSIKELQTTCELASPDAILLEDSIKKMGLSIRSTHRILRLARTIADLKGQENIQSMHLLEALSYRRLEKLYKA